MFLDGYKWDSWCGDDALEAEAIAEAEPDAETIRTAVEDAYAAAEEARAAADYANTVGNIARTGGQNDNTNESDDKKECKEGEDCDKGNSNATKLFAATLTFTF